MRTYDELIQLPTFNERLKYLQTSNVVGKETFGQDRYLNQAFYRSREWKKARDFAIIRDGSCDLAISELVLFDQIVVHHINPITVEDLIEHPELALDPRFLITTCEVTHNMIHYGVGGAMDLPTERFRNDTSPWRL